MEKLKRLTSRMSFRIISSIILLLFVFGSVVSGIGYMKFTRSLTNEYNISAFRTAETAATIVDGDMIDDYLERGHSSVDYHARWERMNNLCQTQNVTLIYVIDVDTSDYDSFTSVFNTVNDDSGYTPWEVGYVRDTTNEEYRNAYRDIYEGKAERASILRTKDLRGRPPHISSLIPIKSSNGVVQCILCVERPMEELIVDRMDFLRWISIVTMTIAVATSIFAAFYLKAQFVTPIQKIIKEAKRFAKENKKSDTSVLENVSKITEIRALGRSVEKMESDTVHYMENLTAATAEQERIGTELALATGIQNDMLPHNFPPFPDRSEFEIYASMDPAKEVGGDFYDFFFVDENHLAILIADVSGKGIPAALFMMVSKIILGNFAVAGLSPKDVLERTNATICQNNVHDMFVTVWLGLLDCRTGKIVCANAGHEYPTICRKDGKFELFKDRHGFVIGGMDGVRYREYEIELFEGDTLFLYTDGLPEATNAENEMLGTDLMLEALNSAEDPSPEGLLKHIKNYVSDFVGEAPQFDDLTMMALKFIEKTDAENAPEKE